MRNTLYILLVASTLASCIQLKPIALYEEMNADEQTTFEGFYATEVWSEQMNGDVWFTQSPNCITVKNDELESNHFLHLQWNKQAGDCPWMGLGIGWDNWSGKDLTGLENQAALQLDVKSFSGDLKAGLPGALGLEDFSGNQSWVGLYPQFVQGNVIDAQWRKMVIPLSLILKQNSGLDISAIKQMIFTLESEGNIGIDNIKWIRYEQQ